MNSQKTVILAIGAAVIMVACAVLGVAIVNDNSTSTNTNQNSSESQFAMAEENTDSTGLIGESISTKPANKYDRDVWSNELQYFLSGYVDDFGDISLYQFMVKEKRVFYKGQTINSGEELAQILAKEGYSMSGNSVRLDYSENSISDLNGVTVKEFFDHAVSNTTFQPIKWICVSYTKWQFNPISIGVE